MLTKLKQLFTRGNAPSEYDNICMKLEQLEMFKNTDHMEIQNLKEDINNANNNKRP